MCWPACGAPRSSASKRIRSRSRWTSPSAFQRSRWSGCRMRPSVKAVTGSGSPSGIPVSSSLITASRSTSRRRTSGRRAPRSIFQLRSASWRPLDSSQPGRSRTPSSWASCLSTAASTPFGEYFQSRLPPDDLVSPGCFSRRRMLPKRQSSMASRSASSVLSPTRSTR